MSDMRALIRELADWDRQCFPLGGGNLIDLLVAHGFVSATDAESIYRDAIREFGDSCEWPPALYTPVGPDGPAKSAWAKRDDDEIPF
jgi:hypothetical protein